MKKKILLLVSCILALGLAAYAQDSRSRTPQTVVSDVLARTPSQNAADAALDASDLAVSAPATVRILSGFLTDAAVKAKAEYALSNLSSYASSHPDVAGKVLEGFESAILASGDPVAKDFLLRQMIAPSGKNEAPFFTRFASDPALAATAVGALVNLGAKDQILYLLGSGSAPLTLLAPAVSDLGLDVAEPLLVNAASSASGTDLAAACKALGEIGSASSLALLKEKSPADEVVLLKRLSPSPAALKEAGRLLDSGDSFIRCAAADVLLGGNSPKKALSLLGKLLDSPDRALRNSALASATDALGPGKVMSLLDKKYDRLAPEAKADVLNWAGDSKVSEALPKVLASFNEDGETGAAAIRSAALIGGDKAISALIDALSTDKASLAVDALLRTKGDVSGAVASALKDAEGVRGGFLSMLAGTRRVKAAADDVIRLCSDPVASKAASLSLEGVVSEKHIPALAALLDNAKGDINDYIKALSTAIKPLESADALAKVKSFMAASPNPEYYDQVIASIATPEALDFLRNRFRSEGDKTAQAALLSVDSPLVIKDLKEAGRTNDGYLGRYVSALSKYETNPDALRFGYADALNMTSRPEVKADILGKVGDMPLMKSFLLAGSYLDDPSDKVRYAAAQAVKKIASKCTEEINYDDLKSCLEKSKAIFKAHGSADDGYAVDEIDKMLLEAAPSEKSELTAEEKRLGFEMLFDGTDLSKWHGDKEGYTPVNGTIYVSANYGATGNLYTNKQYRNFIYRFEFCFLESGVNNGVGIRTPEGVDAAFDAMCEVQILDHDAPIYAGLQPYQVHGSVYGVVPAKRIVHKPLGEWGCEEIIVKGDHIKVTVNGEVVVDADIRKVVKGHNVAPDGSSVNPYTVDHRNHPGMFNPRGYISFCGHGAGLKIRNVRILELPD